MKKIITALGVASSVTGLLAWAEERSSRPDAAALTFQFKREHAWIGVIVGMLVLVA